MKKKSKSKNQKAKIQIKKQKFFLAIIVIIGLALRLVNLRSWLHFEMDEEVIAWKLRPFLQEGKPFLIGGGTPFGFHLGPAFYYLSAIPLFFSRLDPIGWGVAAAILGVMTIWLMWLVGRNLYGRRVGLMAALFWATSFTAVMSDRHWWPLVLDPILSLLAILVMLKISRSPRRPPRRISRNDVIVWWMFLGLVLAFAWQADLTVLPLFLAVGVVAVLNFRRQWKGILITAGILTVSFLPLVFFELRHPGQNLSKLFSYEFLKRSDPAATGSDLMTKPLAETIIFISTGLSRLLFPISHLDGNLLKFYTWCREIADGRVGGQPWWATGLAGLILFIPFVSMKFAKHRRYREVSQTSQPADQILRIVILSGVGGIFLFKLMGGNLYDFYLSVLYPVVLILAARAVYFIWRKWGKIAAIVGLGVIVGLNLATIIRVYHPQSLLVKQQAVAWAISQVGKKDFELDSLSGCSRYNGVRYLFFLENMEPVKSFVDQDLSWLYPSYDEQSRPEYLVTFATPSDLTGKDRKRYNQLQTSSIAAKHFGDLEVLIQEFP